MPHAKFSEEYSAIRDILRLNSFDGELKKPMEGVKGILEVTGPDLTHYPKLENMRTATLKSKETDRILEGAGVAADGGSAPTIDQLEKIAAVKFLRHLHMAGVRGSQTVWVFSTPKDYSKYPYDELDGAKSTLASIKAKLDKTAEQFDSTTQTRLAEATQLGLAWCQKAQSTLSSAKTDEKAMEKVKRWFASTTTSEDDLTKVIGNLSAGFKKVTKTLNDNRVIITDHPPDRKDSSKDYVEAYVYTATETPKTIYIEKAFFSNFEISVLHDMKKNWARVLVHECTHIDIKTKDKGYAWAGIKPGVKITPENAAINADSWAFFAADCGGALVENDINRALNGTGGKATKLESNWTS